MNTTGIIAEYNPFHNGHAYQIRKAKELAGADYCVVVMSGDFVQRGAPAIYDKYTRARMALLGGADLVVEMPPIFAVSSAEDFAACGVAILDRLGVVDTVCFGSECGQIRPLMTLAEILCQNPEEYETCLAEALESGLTFPQARIKALEEYERTCEDQEASRRESPADPDLLSTPNNILGVEYCKALIRRKSPIKPVTLLRRGDSYHAFELPGQEASADAAGNRNRASENFNSGFDENSSFPSAAALRQVLGSGNPDLIRSHFTRISHCVPPSALSLIRDAVPVLPEDLSVLLSYRLLQLQLNQADLTDFLDVSEGLAARINRQTFMFADFENRISSLKTRQYTYTRVSRALIHILLGMTGEESRSRKSGDYVSCARILGFRRSAQPLLSAVKKAASLPMVTKTADAASILGDKALRDFRRDLYVSHLYQSVLASKSGRKIPNEYTASVVVVP